MREAKMEYLFTSASIVSVTFWIVIWVMHLCALINAKLKLNKQTHSLARRRRKLEHLKQKFLPFLKVNPNKSSYSLQIDNNHLYRHTESYQTNQNSDKQSSNRCQLNSLNSPHSQPPNEKHYPMNENTKASAPTSVNIIDGIVHQANHYPPYMNLPLPGVSIIKPLVGIDTNLHANLETFFTMDYPIFELLFCVQDPDDAAILIVENLIRAYPHVDAKLFIGGTHVGVNPKINNMQPAYEATKYELILISDSGISMKKDTLFDMVSHMYDDVALVHQMPFVCDQQHGFQSVVEKVYFGTAHARAYLTADLLNINCPTGMSALMRKHLLDEVGGIKAFGQYLAEDFFFAKSLTDRGWKLSISSQPAWQNPAHSSDTPSTLNSRIQRWIKLRFAMVPQWTLLEPFSECMLLGLLAAMSISFLWALDPYAIFLFHVLLWFLFDYMLLCTIQNGPLKFSKTDFAFAWLTRESTALLIFLKALANPKVNWRSRKFRLKWGGHAEEISPPDAMEQSKAASATLVAPISCNCIEEAKSSCLQQIAYGLG